VPFSCCVSVVVVRSAVVVRAKLGSELTCSVKVLLLDVDAPWFVGLLCRWKKKHLPPHPFCKHVCFMVP
jgi:hypothetical protein